jgi:hypothetical protein
LKDPGHAPDDDELDLRSVQFEKDRMGPLLNRHGEAWR